MKTNKGFNNSKTFNFYNQKQNKNKNLIHNTTGNINEVNTKIDSPKHNSSTNHSHNFKKVTEKDCTDLRNLVKKSVDDINDILNSTEIKKSNFMNINNNKGVFQKKHQSALSLDNNMNNSTSLKSENRNLSNSKTNFTVNINNYINIPSNSINSTSKKIKKYEEKMILTQNDKQIKNYNNNTINKENKFIPERLIKSLNSITVNKKIMNTNSSQYKNSENNEIKNNFLNNKISISPNPKQVNEIKLQMKKKLSNRKKLSYTQKLKKPTEFFNQKLNSSINNISSYIYQPHTPREYEVQNLKIKNNYTRSISSNSKTIIRNINSSSNISKQNNSFLSKEKCISNYQQILDKIYSKEFPYEIINTNDILKLMLFLNEYLINCNVLKDYYQQENSDLLNEYSKFLVSKIKINSPEIQINHNDLDKVVNSAKIIQRRWRKKKVKNYLGEKNETQELKKMIINNYIQKNGYKVKKVIGLFNSLVEDFENLCVTNKDMSNMIYYISKIVNKSLTNFEEHLLYKDFINNIILMKY